MSYKNDPAFLKMLENTADDEPIFLVCGRDLFSPGTVREWIRQAERHGIGGMRSVPAAKINEAIGCAAAMDGYRPKKVPD